MANLVIDLPVVTIDGASFGIATTPTIAAVAAAVANTEYSYTLPAGTKQFEIKAASSASRIQLGYNIGESTTKFITVSPGGSYEAKGLSTTSLTLYFQVNKAPDTVQITAWV